jgi:NADPH:quinone reductase-like Zn-dependent oxidoreductase
VRAVQFGSYGGPEVLELVEIDEPHAGPGQVRIKVRTLGVNPADWKFRSGSLAAILPRELPMTTGSEAAGTIDEVGEGVEEALLGTDVFGSAIGGAAAEYAVLGSWTAKPPELSFEEVAGYAAATETARRALGYLPLPTGGTLVVNGAAGNVGLAIVQFAVADGFTVVGTAREANHEKLRQLGAIPTTYGDGMIDRIRALCPQGVDGALDVAGNGVLPELIELTGSPEQVVTVADPTGPEQGVLYPRGGGPDRAVGAPAEAVALAAQGRFEMPVRATFPFEQIADAHRLSETGHGLGKIVVVVDQ